MRISSCQERRPWMVVYTKALIEKLSRSLSRVDLPGQEQGNCERERMRLKQVPSDDIVTMGMGMLRQSFRWL